MLTLPPLPATAPGARYWVAYSGGLDSTVLLHLARQSQLPGLSAVHVHHGLQAMADDWAADAVALCEQWGVPLRVQKVHVLADHPQGPEGAARAARYAALAAVLAPGDVLLTAHHQADQAETLLLRLLRGAALTGLGAMPALAPLGVGQLWRPLLDVPKSALEHYAAQHALPRVDDPHNHDARYTRSWLRTAILPRLRERFPTLDETLAQTAGRLREADTVLNELLEAPLQALQLASAALSISRLVAETPARQRLLLRAWVRRLGLPMPGSAALDAIRNEILPATSDATPLVVWPGAECRRYRDALYCAAPLPPLPVSLQRAWDGCMPLRLPPGCGTWVAAKGDIFTGVVRLAESGDTIRLAGRSHRQRFKKLAQAAGLPSWVRRRLPVLVVDGTVVSIAGHWNADGAPELHWHPDPLPGLDWPPKPRV